MYIPVFVKSLFYTLSFDIILFPMFVSASVEACLYEPASFPRVAGRLIVVCQVQSLTTTFCPLTIYIPSGRPVAASCGVRAMHDFIRRPSTE